MHRSESRIHSTHVGSLPRTDTALEYLDAGGESATADDLSDTLQQATDEVVQHQVDAGLDIINGGEQGRPSFVTYVVNRLSGFEGEVPAIQWMDLEEYPAYAERVPTFRAWSDPDTTIPAATGPITYEGEAVAQAEIDALERAVDETDADIEDTFVTAAAPGAVAAYLGNEHYDSHEAFVNAVADALRTEYELITDSGAILQIDAPDLLGGRHLKFKDHSESAFVDTVRTHIEALNRALTEVPAEQVRLHTCWGNYEGPHHHDVPLESVLPELYEADIGGLLIEQANPCHQHDYRLFGENPLPDGWVLVPGVIDVTVNYIEPADVVADRLERFVEVVGDPTRVIAGADCGLGTFAEFGAVHPDIAWRKLEALAEGAAVATERVF